MFSLGEEETLQQPPSPHPNLPRPSPASALSSALCFLFWRWRVGVRRREEGAAVVGEECVSYYCAQYIHQATQGESKRVTDKYITLSSTSQDTVHNKVGHLAETKGAAAAPSPNVSYTSGRWRSGRSRWRRGRQRLGGGSLALLPWTS